MKFTPQFFRNLIANYESLAHSLEEIVNSQISKRKILLEQFLEEKSLIEKLNGLNLHNFHSSNLLFLTIKIISIINQYCDLMLMKEKKIHNGQCLNPSLDFEIKDNNFENISNNNINNNDNNNNNNNNKEEEEEDELDLS